MKTILTFSRAKLPARLRRVTIGCGIQGHNGLALAVCGRPGAWTIEWGLFGARHDRRFAARLAKKVWRRPFWTVPWETYVEQESVVMGIDLSFARDANGKRPGTAEIKAALRTQLMANYPHPAKPAALLGLEIRGADGPSHVVGAVAARADIQQSYVEWRSDVGILFPHIGCNALALANLYLALYPEAARTRNPHRLLVLEGRETTHAVLMDDWRLLGCIQYQMMAGQQLDRPLLEEWTTYCHKQYAVPGEIIPCVLNTGREPDPDEFGEVWSPFDNHPEVRCDQPTRKQIMEHVDLAPLAFGMALHGG